MRATHVEAPALDASERYPDLYGTRSSPSEEPARASRGTSRSRSPRRARGVEERADEPEQEELTPMGNRRSAVTEADDYDYRLPKPSLPEALQRRPEGRHEGHRAHRRAS